MSVVSDLRRSLSMTQEQFAEYCDVSRSSIARYDAGAPINRTNAIKIAIACKVPVDFVLGREGVSEVNQADKNRVLLSSEERQMIADYRKLSMHGKRRMQETMHEMNILYRSSEKKG